MKNGNETQKQSLLSDVELTNLTKQFEMSSLQMDREVELVHKRLTWALSFHGFLFATIAFTLRAEQFKNVHKVMFEAVPVAGVITAFFTLCGVWASAQTRNRIRKYWDSKIGDQQASQERIKYIKEYFPPFYSTTGVSLTGKAPSYGILLTLMVIWIYIFVGFKFESHIVQLRAFLSGLV